eukprot:4247731-Prymnesium_polylepis.1
MPPCDLHVAADDARLPNMACAPHPNMAADDARLLSEVAGEKVDEVFIGSCMTNIGHFRAAGKML